MSLTQTFCLCNVTLPRCLCPNSASSSCPPSPGQTACLPMQHRHSAMRVRTCKGMGVVWLEGTCDLKIYGFYCFVFFLTRERSKINTTAANELHHGQQSLNIMGVAPTVVPALQQSLRSSTLPPNGIIKIIPIALYLEKP